MASLQSTFLKLLIKRLNLFSGPKHDPQSMRQRTERFASKSRPRRGVRLFPADADTVPAEWLIPPGAPGDRVLLYLHGGAWFLGSPRLYRGYVSGLAHASGIRALVIDYRLAPENPFPAGLEDCLTAYVWLLQTGIPADQIVVAGDSAGGNLTLALLIALRDAGKPLPAAAVALSPVTDLTGSGKSYQTRRRLDPFFGRMTTNHFILDYIGDHDPHHAYISPLFGDLRGLPPLLIHVGDHEILLDDAVKFGEKAAASGVEAKTVVWPQMFHVFPIFGSLLPEARRANAQIVAFIRSHVEGAG